MLVCTSQRTGVFRTRRRAKWPTPNWRKWIRFKLALTLKFPPDKKGIPSSDMALGAKEYSSKIREFLAKHAKARQIFLKAFLQMPTVSQMLLYFYRLCRLRTRLIPPRRVGRYTTVTVQNSRRMKPTCLRGSKERVVIRTF